MMGILVFFNWWFLDIPESGVDTMGNSVGGFGLCFVFSATTSGSQ